MYVFPNDDDAVYEKEEENEIDRQIWGVVD